MKFPDNMIYRLHAVRRMFERDISEEAIKAVLRERLIIQEYADDKPYPSYLVAGKHEERPLHVVVSVNIDDQTAIIVTAYVPDLNEWESGYTIRRKKMNCVICKQGSTEPGLTSITLEREGMLLIVKGVPAEICSNCGESYVGSEATHEILKLANAAHRTGVQVEICSFKAA